MSLMQVWFSFNGRINRSTFWLKGILGELCLTVVVMVFLGLVFALGGLDPDDPQESPWPLLVLLFWMVLLFWINLAVYAKRWHDHDMSGWWSALLFVPIVNFFWGIYMLIKLGFLKGTDGSNRYGPAP